MRDYDECVERWGDGSRKHYSRWNNAQDCSDNGGVWTTFSNYLETAPRELAQQLPRNRAT